MKAIEGINLLDIHAAAEAKLKAAQTEKLTLTLVKLLEEHDTLEAQIVKDEAATVKKKAELAKKAKVIDDVKAGKWESIQDNAQQQPQVNKGDKGGQGGGKPEEKAE